VTPLLGVVLALAFSAPPSEEAVLDVVDRFFEAYHARDAETGLGLITDEAVGRQVVMAEGGRPIGLSPPIDIAAFVRRWAELETRNAELYWEPKVELTEGLAQVFAPYVLEVDGKLVHCGVDAFTLVESSGEWRIEAIQFTAEPTGCERLGYDPNRDDLRPLSLVQHLSGRGQQ
jgi:hypothetical protein